MKKGLFIALLSILCVFSSKAQQGELSVGLNGGYFTMYKDLLYGVNVDYNVSDRFQLSFSEMINPSATIDDDIMNTVDKIKMYATNLDMRLWLVHQRDWAMGPGIGVQYLIERGKDNDYLDDERFGFNLGWHIRANVAENIRVTGGWKWTSLQESQSNHLFYLGVNYAFYLF